MAVASPRLAQNVPLPDSPVTLKKTGAKGKKVKGKERSVAEVAVESEVGDATPWQWESLTDSFASSVPPVFTKDGSYFFSAVGPSVKIFSVATGQVVSTLSTPDLPVDNHPSAGIITSLALNPHNPFQLITGSSNGYIIVWDFLDATLLQVLDINQPIQCICVHEKFKDVVFVAATRNTSKGNSDVQSAVLRVSLKSTQATIQSRIQKSSEITPIGKTRSTAGLSLSPSGTWLVAVAGHKAYVAQTSTLKSGFTKYVSPERLTCLAFHPSEDYFATGDDKGNIRLWYCLNDVPVHAVGVEKKAQTTTLHWHAHSVASITFTSNGAYLLSGGEESVLVIWQLHTGKKEFVPRVGAPIKTVSLSKTQANEEEYLLGLADATHVFVSAATLKISRSYSRIKLDSTNDVSSTRLSVPLAVHQLTSTLILPSSHASSLQTYAPSTSKLISELEVSPSNRISRRDEKPMNSSHVERCVIDPSGKWMATIDHREGDETFRGETYLKLWSWNQKSHYWSLNTRIDRPHGLKAVTAVAFSPQRNHLCLVTTGKDGHIKTWGIRTVKEKSGLTEEFWITRSTFSFRAQIPSHASWSPDGSLLAVTAGQYVALYNPITNNLYQTIISSDCKDAKSAHFVGRGGRYLAIVGSRDVVIWDLVAQSVRWHYNSTWLIDTIVTHPLDDKFALFHLSTAVDGHARTRVQIFSPNSSRPIRTHSVPFSIRTVTWYHSLDSTDKFSLVAITAGWGVVVMGDQVQLPALEGSVAREIAADASVATKTLFQDIFGKSAFADHSSKHYSHDATVSTPWTGQDITSIFDGPAYLMPPLNTLFEHAMGSFLKQRSETEQEAPPAEVDEDQDVEMEDALEPFVSNNEPKRVVSQFEMDGLIDLFKQYSVKSKPSHPLPRTTPAVHKIPSVNGAMHSATSSAASTPKQKPNGLATKIIPASLADTSAAGTMVNGKKRKKSL